jgi:hypothetical protein
MAEPPFTCPFCGAVCHYPRGWAVDWDLVQWRAAFRIASAARDAKITALLLELRAEAEAREG